MSTVYSSTLTVESQKFPNVKFVLRKMSETRRAEFRRQTADVQARLRELNRKAARLAEQVGSAENPLDPEMSAQIEDLSDQITGLVSTELNPAYVRWGLKSVSGLLLANDDEPDAEPRAITTADELLADGPPELSAEICGAIMAAANMTEEELKNFKLPSISGAPMDGTKSNSSATDASSGDTSAPETAESTSRS